MLGSEPAPGRLSLAARRLPSPRLGSGARGTGSRPPATAYRMPPQREGVELRVPSVGAVEGRAYGSTSTLILTPHERDRMAIGSCVTCPNAF